MRQRPLFLSLLHAPLPFASIMDSTWPIFKSTRNTSFRVLYVPFIWHGSTTHGLSGRSMECSQSTDHHASWNSSTLKLIKLLKPEVSHKIISIHILHLGIAFLLINSSTNFYRCSKKPGRDKNVLKLEDDRCDEGQLKCLNGVLKCDERGLSCDYQNHQVR